MFEPLNNFFDKIYVITLERAADRHAHLQKELAGLNFQLMYGADKKELDPAELVRSNVYNPSLAKKHHPVGKEMRPGEIAISLSHRKVYEDVVRNNYEKVLILEDDVVIDKNTIGLFEKIVTELPAGWGLWYLGFAKNETPPANAGLKKMFYHLLCATGIKKNYNHTMIRNLYPKPFSAHLQRAGFHDCAHAYAITTDTAKLLLKMQQPVSYVADHLLGYASCGRLADAFITVPKLINQQYQVFEHPVQSYLQQ